jgi:hypothetical protein
VLRGFLFSGGTYDSNNINHAGKDHCPVQAARICLPHLRYLRRAEFSYDYGPLGAELLRSIRNRWWEEMIYRRPDMVGIDSQILLHPETWVASGHVTSFTEPLVEDRVTHKRYRADHLIDAWLAKNPQPEIVVENLSLSRWQA